jgi:hypothetical protein
MSDAKQIVKINIQALPQHQAIRVRVPLESLMLEALK